MATTTAAPGTVAPAEETVKKAPLVLTPQAIAKVREIMATQDPLPAGLRIGVAVSTSGGFLTVSWVGSTVVVVVAIGVSLGQLKSLLSSYCTVRRTLPQAPPSVHPLDAPGQRGVAETHLNRRFYLSPWPIVDPFRGGLFTIAPFRSYDDQP